MIKDRIKNKQEELCRLKSRYKELSSKIKDVFFEKDYYKSSDSPKKLLTEERVFQAALCLLEEYCPGHYFNTKVTRAKDYRDGYEKVLDYYFIYSDRGFNQLKGDSYVVLRKKNIKALKDRCKKIWIKEVSENISSSTILGFEEWLKKTSIDDILSLMHEYFRKDISVITDKSLGIKDVVFLKKTY